LLSDAAAAAHSGTIVPKEPKKKREWGYFTVQSWRIREIGSDLFIASAKPRRDGTFGRTAPLTRETRHLGDSAENLVYDAFLRQNRLIALILLV